MVKLEPDSFMKTFHLGYSVKENVKIIDVVDLVLTCNLCNKRVTEDCLTNSVDGVSIGYLIVRIKN